jgi:hypothetical protein
MALVTKAEVIAGAFTRTIQESRIPTDLLSVAQYKYLRPILGEDFYNAVVAAPSSYIALLVYVKPVLNWYVRYMALPEMRVELSDLGANTININGTTSLTDEGFAAIRDQTLIVAESKVQELNDYLEDNTSLYPLYYKSKNASENCHISGGIIMKRTKKDFDSNDYFIDK